MLIKSTFGCVNLTLWSASNTHQFGSRARGRHKDRTERRADGHLGGPAQFLKTSLSLLVLVFNPYTDKMVDTM